MRSCNIIRRLAQEENNLEEEKIKAIRVLLVKSGSLKSMDKEIELLLSDAKVEELMNRLGQVWDSQARLQAILSQLSEGATPKQQRMIAEINIIGTNLKKDLYFSTNIVEDEKKKLIVILELLRKKVKQVEAPRNTKDISFKLALEELLEEKSRIVMPNKVVVEEDEEDTQYYSFNEDPETMKQVQSSFFQKNGDGLRTRVAGPHLEVDETSPITFFYDKEFDFKERKEQIENQKNRENILKTLNAHEAKLEVAKLLARRRASGAKLPSQVGNLPINKIPFKQIRDLITSNPAFIKYKIDDGIAKRKKMPVFRDPDIAINVWQLLKQNLGKDLSKITLPVYLNEPLSMIQKVAEYLHYEDCFRKANQCEDEYLRIGYILAGFFMYYAHTINRIKKPFNSLLGETYEYIENDLRMIVEQVSHHPPVCAFYCTCDDFILEGFFHMAIKFSYKGLSATPAGDLIMTLKRTNERFVITRPISSLHNYIVGKMYIWNSGDMIVRNETTGSRAIMYFKPKGWTSKNDYEAEGKIMDSEGATRYSLFGNWNAFASAIDIRSKKEIKLVEKMKGVPDYEQQYFYSAFTIGLNHLTKEMTTKLPMTDTRYRSDQRAYEYGDLTLAADEKNRLEEAQRARRKNNDKNFKNYIPLWFELVIDEGMIVGSNYKGGYWEARESATWPADMIDIMNN